VTDKPENDYALPQLLFLSNFFLTLGLVISTIVEWGTLSVSVVYLLFGFYAVFCWFLLTYETPGALVILAGTQNESSESSINLTMYIRIQVYLLVLNLFLFFDILTTPQNTFLILGFYPVILFFGMIVQFLLSESESILKNTLYFLGFVMFLFSSYVGNPNLYTLSELPKWTVNVSIAIGITMLLGFILDKEMATDPGPYDVPI
jgi:hypothetical protein